MTEFSFFGGVAFNVQPGESASDLKCPDVLLNKCPSNICSTSSA